MGNADYSKNVLDHFQNPRNMRRFARSQVAGRRSQVEYCALFSRDLSNGGLIWGM